MSYIHIEIGADDLKGSYATRCQKIMHRLFEQGFFDIKSGSFTAHFDEFGNLRTWDKIMKGNEKNPHTSLPSLPREHKIELK